MTPNHVTLLTTAVAWAATLCFFTGQLGIGLVLALAVGVLDGVDGKLARLRLQHSRLGRHEHKLDGAYEISWWVALAYHLWSSGALPSAWTAGFLLAALEAVDGIAKVTVLRRFGRTIDEMGRFDRFVRLWGGRRNVYVWLMAAGAAIGNAPAAFALLPWWEGVTAVVHAARAWWLVRDAGQARRLRPAPRPSPSRP